MSLTAATWTGAIATVLLVFGAVATALYARNAYREQSRQTREIREQTRLLQEQADRDIRQRHRAQATQVFTWVEMRPYDGKAEDMRPAARIKNASGQPVYDIELGLGLGVDKARVDRRLPVLMPGNDYELVGLGTDFADGRGQIWITFRDAAGVRWRTTSDGRLTELPGEPDAPT
jgi:hypothetical protein